MSGAMMVQPPQFRGGQGGSMIESDKSEVVDGDDVSDRNNVVDERDISSSVKQDYGIELVWNRTSDSQRARDMIIPPQRRRIPYFDDSEQLRECLQVETVDSISAQTENSKISNQSMGRSLSNFKISKPSVDSLHSHQNEPRSMFMTSSNPDAQSVASKSVDTLHSRALFDDVSESSSVTSSMLYPLKEDDTIWRAAKRGDLAALKRFHGQGKVDWAAKDQFGNTPLYYACHSGTIVDINVVRFLLWVTPIENATALDKCRNRKNKAVIKALDEFEGNGYIYPLPTGNDRQYIPISPPREKGKKMKNDIQRLHESENRDSENSRPPPPEPTRSSAKPRVADECSVSTKNTQKSSDALAVNSSLESIVKDVNKIQVSPSTVTNMTIDADEWSLGSMLSFGKKLRQKKSSLERKTNNDDQSIGNRSTVRLKDASLRRKISFDQNEHLKKNTPRFRWSPREKVLHVDKNSKDDESPPRVEYEEKLHQWSIENHATTDKDAETSNIVLTIHVFDSNQKVVIQNCHGVSIDIQGRTMKSVSIKDSSDLNVVFDSVSDDCNITHCRNIAAETTGICRRFSMERAKGINIWLSRESRDVSKIVTSKCTEVSVLLPTGASETEYERQELTVPEKYTHQFTGGTMRSRVSSVA